MQDITGGWSQLIISCCVSPEHYLVCYICFYLFLLLCKIHTNLLISTSLFLWPFLVQYPKLTFADSPVRHFWGGNRRGGRFSVTWGCVSLLACSDWLFLQTSVIPAAGTFHLFNRSIFSCVLLFEFFCPRSGYKPTLCSLDTLAVIKGLTHKLDFDL